MNYPYPWVLGGHGYAGPVGGWVWLGSDRKAWAWVGMAHAEKIPVVYYQGHDNASKFYQEPENEHSSANQNLPCG